MLLPRTTPDEGALQDLAARYPDLEPDDLHVFLRLVYAGSRVFAAVESWMGRRGLSTARFVVLVNLNLDPDNGLTPSDLADRVSASRATITGLVDGLVRDKLVTREHCTEDRRTVRVRLTEAGREMLSKVLPGHFRRVSALVSRLSARDRRDLLRLSRRIGDAADALPDDWPADCGERVRAS